MARLCKVAWNQWLTPSPMWTAAGLIVRDVVCETVDEVPRRAGDLDDRVEVVVREVDAVGRPESS